MSAVFYTHGLTFTRNTGYKHSIVKGELCGYGSVELEAVSREDPRMYVVLTSQCTWPASWTNTRSLRANNN